LSVCPCRKGRVGHKVDCLFICLFVKLWIFYKNKRAMLGKILSNYQSQSNSKDRSWLWFPHQNLPLLNKVRRWNLAWNFKTTLKEDWYRKQIWSPIQFSTCQVFSTIVLFTAVFYMNINIAGWYKGERILRNRPTLPEIKNVFDLKQLSYKAIN
jgi:hypothetical protein